MRIAYLLHYMGKNYEEITENIDQLIDGGDDVFVMINDEELRDQVFMAYASVPEMHLCISQPSALPADLSLPRGSLMAIRQALEAETDENITYDWFINLGDGMMPVKNRKEIEAFLQSLQGRDAWHKVSDSDVNEAVKERFEEYAFFTNSMDFQKSKMIRGMNNLTKNVVKKFKKRETDDLLVETWPWFVISHDTAKELAEHYDYCSTNFKMCLYPEELCLGTMIHKYAKEDPVQADIWCIGDGTYELGKKQKPLTPEALAVHPETLFAGPLKVDEDAGFYADLFDTYTKTGEE